MALVLPLAGCTGKESLPCDDRTRKAVLTTHRFAYSVIAADQLVAVTNILKFKYDDGRTLLQWVTGENVDAAVWVTVFIVIVTLINMFPVQVRTSSLLRLGGEDAHLRS